MHNNRTKYYKRETGKINNTANKTDCRFTTRFDLKYDLKILNKNELNEPKEQYALENNRGTLLFMSLIIIHVLLFITKVRVDIEIDITSQSVCSLCFCIKFSCFVRLSVCLSNTHKSRHQLVMPFIPLA